MASRLRYFLQLVSIGVFIEKNEKRCGASFVVDYGIICVCSVGLAKWWKRVVYSFPEGFYFSRGVFCVEWIRLLTSRIVVAVIQTSHSGFTRAVRRVPFATPNP